MSQFKSTAKSENLRQASLQNPTTMNCNTITKALKQMATPERASSMMRFFKCGPGEYGEGDEFWGIAVPDQRKVARRFRDLPLDQIDRLLQEKIHECRLTALFILVDQFKRACNQSQREQLVKFYLKRTDRVNNWDLVDSSAPQILGELLIAQKDRKLLIKLARSKCLWEQRIAVVANQPLIRRGEFDSILLIAEMLLDHPHDLIHKATGWMLREVGDRDSEVLHSFLKLHCRGMPRTMLRYSIEKLTPERRSEYMKK